MYALETDIKNVNNLQINRGFAKYKNGMIQSK